MKKQELVFMAGKEILTDSRIVAEKFCVENNKMNKTIQRILKQEAKIQVELHSTSDSVKYETLFIEKKGKYQGQNYVYYEMNKKAFIKTAMRFETKEARIWQDQFIDAFLNMEKYIFQVKNNKLNEEWLEARNSGKIARRIETDVIKVFVEYTKAHGSKNGERYYQLLTEATYKALFIIKCEYKHLRDLLDKMQAGTLLVAENMIAKTLEEEMKKGTEYHEIYRICRDKLIVFAEMVGKSEVEPKHLQLGFNI